MNEGLEALPASTLPNPFRDPVGVVERHWRWMLATLVFGLLASLMVWSCSAPQYFAEATVVVARSPLSERILDPGAADSGATVTEALTAEVLSHNNLAQLVRDFGLYPDLAGVETTPEITERVRSGVSIHALQRLALTPGSEGYERAYSIGFAAATPEAAAGVANRIATLFAETSSAGRVQEQQATLSLLKQELSEAERKLQEQTDAIARFRSDNRGLLPEELAANLSRLQTLDERRSALTGEIATLASTDDASPALRLARLRDQLTRLRVNKTERHPDVRNVERQIAELEQQLKGKRVSGTSRSSVQLSDQTLRVIRQQLASTQAEIATLDAQIQQASSVQQDLKALEERASMLRENYLAVLRKVQNAELGGKLLDTQHGRRVSVLNSAEPPSRPFRTPLRNLMLAMLATLIGTLAVGLGLEMLHPVVVAADDITRISGLPVLGWVPRIR